MKNKTTTTDNRPRFGWTSDLDNEPQTIFEHKPNEYLKHRPVAVIPLPCASSAVRAKVRAFVNGTLFPKS